MLKRQPMALANWKMEMTVAESLAFLQRFQAEVGDLLAQVQVVLCPPYTALHPMTQVLDHGPIELGAQTVSAAAGGAHTGEVSARLVADVGARWALLGHWELRRQRGETDEMVNHKVHRALEAHLRPILLIGEGKNIDSVQVGRALSRQLARVLAGCTPDQVAGMAFVYEPEWTIGVSKPAPPRHVEASCRFIRHWLAGQFSPDTSQAVRILYGGSVSPAHATGLLALPDLDGLGAGRKGRDPDTFAEIVRMIAQTRLQ